MNRFRSSKVGDVTEPVGTWNPVRDAKETFRYIELSAVDQEAKAITKAALVEPWDAPSRARQLVRIDDILVSTVRPNLNAVARVTKEFDGTTASTGFCVLRPSPAKVDPLYLFHWVRTPRFIGDMMRNATGASYPAVSDRIVKASEFPLPPLDEQRRIAVILDKADALRQKRKRAVNLMNGLVQSIFLEMFGDPTTNPKRLPTAALGDLLRVKSGNGLTAAQMDSSGSYVVYGGNGPNGTHSGFMFVEPQIVIGRVGVYCGAVHITEPNSWVTDNALYVSELKRPLDQTYLASALSMANLNRLAGRAAQPLISGGRIYPVEILLPDAEHQVAFARATAKVARLASELDVTPLTSLFSSLQRRLLLGEMEQV